MCLQHCQSLFHLWDTSEGMVVRAAAPRGPSRALASLPKRARYGKSLPSTALLLAGAPDGNPRSPAQDRCPPLDSWENPNPTLRQNTAPGTKTLHAELQRINLEGLEWQTLKASLPPQRFSKY